MTVRRENLKALQALVEKPALACGDQPAALGHALADAVLGGGLRPALHEVFAAESGDEAAATGFALAMAARLTGRKWLLWVRQDFAALEAGEPHACGLMEMGIDPARIVMLAAPDATAVLRAGAEGLSCKGLGAVILEAWGEPKVFDLTASRKLTLATQQHGVAAIALRFGADPEPSAAETRWLVKATASPGTEDWVNPLFDAALVRNRRGQTGNWVMEWDCRHGRFAPHPGAVAAAPAHRPAKAAGLRQAG